MRNSRFIGSARLTGGRTALQSASLSMRVPESLARPAIAFASAAAGELVAHGTGRRGHGEVERNAAPLSSPAVTWPWRPATRTVPATFWKRSRA